MKVYQIEDTIIAYFDGRLNDSESAELMHRVSVSPEIRDLFEQHQLLRRMAVRAARNVSVSPNVEDAVFANIAALNAKENKKAGAFWSMRRGAVVAGIAALLGAGIVASLKSSEPNAVPYVAHDAVTVTSDVARVQEVATNDVSNDAPINARPPVAHHAVSTPIIKTDITTPVQSEIAVAPITAVTDARTVQAEQIQPPTIISHSISDLLVSASDDSKQFEIGLANSSQASAIPGSVPGISALSDWSLNALYAFDDQNLAGVRLEEGLFNIQSATPSTDATYWVGKQQQQWTTAYGAYYEHRESIDRGALMIAGDIGAGLFNGGNYVTLGFGGRLPIGDHLMAGATVSLTRKHDGGQTKDEILQKATQPVIFDGADIHNTLITRIEYGLSYRF